MTNSSEEFKYTVNPLGHCWACNQPGHERIKCPALGQSRTSYYGRQDEDICCYNCNKYRHYSRDCMLPNRMRKEQRSWVLEETKKKQSVYSSIDVVYSENVKPRENHQLHNLFTE